MDSAPPATRTPVPPDFDAEIGQMVAHWDRLRGDQRLPAPAAIDPVELKPFLSRLFLVDGPSLEEMHLRLAGTSYRELYGFEITGRRLLDLIPETERPDLVREYRHCRDTAAPVFHAGSMNWRERGAQIRYDRVLLPFGQEGRVTRILGFAVFFDSQGRKILR